ncbi:MAG: type II secretion system F family protein [Clostridiales bacterium]|nr:type II secretion system F family protein [Candidatus Blautia equi]
MKQNYQTYIFTKTEILRYLLESILLCALVDYLFYRSLWLIPLFAPVSFYYFRMKKRQQMEERKKKLNYQFKDALNALSVAVQAGYSVENAISACTRDLERLYQKQDDILEEFHYIENQLRLSIPAEELFLDLGMRSQIEDIENFASVFHTAKRTGGNMENVIRKVAGMLGDKIDVKKEIEASIAAKRSEQLIMSFMPAGIILYLQFTSPGFLDVLYGNILGVCIMTVCLGIYGTAYWLGRKIVNIEV